MPDLGAARGAPAGRRSPSSARAGRCAPRAHAQRRADTHPGGCERGNPGGDAGPGDCVPAPPPRTGREERLFVCLFFFWKRSRTTSKEYTRYQKRKCLKYGWGGAGACHSPEGDACRPGFEATSKLCLRLFFFKENKKNISYKIFFFLLT